MFECHKCDMKFVTKISLNYHIPKLHTQSKKLDAFEKNSDPRTRNMAALNVKRDFTVKYALWAHKKKHRFFLCYKSTTNIMQTSWWQLQSSAGFWEPTNTKFTNLICQHSKGLWRKGFLFLAAHHVTRSLSLKDRLSSTLQNDMENLRKDQQLRLTFDKCEKRFYSKNTLPYHKKRKH